jgi:CHAT domain-containing protein
MGVPTDEALVAAEGVQLPAGACAAVGPDGLGCAHIAALYRNARFLRTLSAELPAALLLKTRTVDPLPVMRLLNPGASVWHAAVAGKSTAVARWLAVFADTQADGALKRLAMQPDESGARPVDEAPWRIDVREQGQKFRSSRDIARLERVEGIGLGTQGTLGFGVGGGRGPASLPNGGDTPDDPTETPPTPPEGHDFDGDSILDEDAKPFQVLGFGGSSQLVEYAPEEDFFAGRLAARQAAGEPDGTADRTRIEHWRGAVRTCVEAGDWRATERLAAALVLEADAMDPFRGIWAAEALHLSARAALMLVGDKAEAAKAPLRTADALIEWFQVQLGFWGVEYAHASSTPGRHPDEALRRAFVAVLSLVAGHHLDRGDQAAARPTIERAMGLVEKDQQRARAHLLGLAGRLETLAGQYDAARKVFAEADELRREIFGAQSFEVVANLVNLGVVEELVGAAFEAEGAWREALATTALLDVPGRALLLALLSHNLARLAFSDGDEVGAANLNGVASEATALPGAGPPWLVGRIALTEGDLAKARAERLGAGPQADIARKEAIAAWRLAATAIEQAHGRGHPLFGRVAWRLADTIDDRNERRSLFIEAWVATDGAPEERWPLAWAFSRFEEGEGRVAVAAAIARAGVIALQRIRQGVAAIGKSETNPALERAWLERRIAVYRDATRLALRVGRSADAMAIIGLQEIESHLAFTRSQDFAGTTPALPIAAADKAFVDGPPARAMAASDGALVRERAADIKAHLDDIDARRANRPPAPLSEQAKQARALQSTLRRIGDRVVWLQLIPTATDITAIITTPKRQVTVTHPLPDIDIARLVGRLRESLLLRKAGVEIAAQQLYAAVFQPFAETLGDARIIYVGADGPLRDLPFAALHDGQGWLGARHAFVTASILTLPRLERSPPALDEWRVEGFGVSRASSGFSALPGVPDELGGVIAKDAQASGFPGRVFLDEAFAPEALFETLRAGTTPAVLIASHFKLGATATDSFLLTGGGFKLTVGCMQDCTTACLAACTEPGASFSFQDVHLAVLSACNTAQQTGDAADPARETLSSLTDVAAILGADAVVGTLWPVFDPSTAAFMRRFFGELRERGGHDKALAMQAAAQAMARGEIGEGKWAHPYFWAPFVMMGNAR